MTDATTQERPDGEAIAELRQLAQLRGEGPVVSPNPLSPPGASRGEPIGKVEATSGEVISSRVDQTSAVLKPGDSIYEGDIVATRGGAGVQIDFANGTIGHLGPQARMLVQDVGTGTGSTAPVMFMINGPFSFASPPGGSAGANALTVRTPVASVRLEGGRLIGRAAPEAVENKFTLMRNFDGTLGRAVVATASASFVLDSELASAQVVSLFRAPSELPTPTLAQAQESVGGSVFDWLGAPAAGDEGVAETGLESIGPISVVLPGGPQLSFPEPQFGALNRLSNSGPVRPVGQENTVTPRINQGNTEVLPPPPDAPNNISVFRSFTGNITEVGTAGFDTFTAQADPSSANSVTISQTLDGKVFLTDGTNTISLDGFEELDINLGTANDSITIGDLSNTDIADSTVRIDLGAGNDTADATAANRRHVIDGGDGDDTITGSSRGDDLNGDAGNDTLKGLAGKDTINGGAGADDIEGGADDDTITGGAGNDTIDGGIGDDAMSGGAGNDSYTVDSALDTVTELAGEGTDTISTGLGFTLPDNVENLVLTGVNNVDGVGNALVNLLTGNSGNNTLDGGAGADVLNGGAGNDTYVVDNVGDTITDTSGADLVQSSVTFTLAANIENLTLTGTGNINGTGNAAVNTLIGNSGNNRLDGLGGADAMTGGAGDDTFVVDDVGDTVSELAGGGTDTVESSITFTLGANFENLTLTGGSNINGTGNTLANTLTGNTGNNTLDGGTGADTMDGGAGNDIYIVDNAGDTVADTAGGTDLVQSSVSFTLASGLENLELTGADAIDGTGNAAANTITGNTGDNVLTGLGGDDTYVVQNAGDSVVEGAGAGTDTVNSSVTFTLGANVENLVLTGGGNINGTGNGDVNTITGNGGNNILDGGAGADALNGGAGNDTYVVDNAGDTLTDTSGTDLVQSSVTFTLGGDLENLTLTSTDNINGTGNAAANTLTGNTGNNRLDGLGGADAMSGDAGDDTYVVDNAGDSVTEGAGAGTDTVESSITFTLGANLENLTLTGSTNINGTGNTLANTLTGNTGNNTLDGGTGADAMDGGAGNDTYIVDNAGDTVADTAGGTDLVQSSVSFTLSSGLENLELTGAAAVDGTGNAAANTITGNTGDNVLTGLGGDDNYFVQNTGDTVIEGAGGGTDTVNSSATFTISDDDVENLTLTGSSSINATGNASSNILTGNTGTNILTGHAGNDTYFVQNAGDTVVEAGGEGTDTVNSSVSFTLSDHVENLILTGTSLTGTGNALANEITGGSGNDTLIGLGGGDTLDGAGGTGDTASYAASGAGVTVVLSGAAGVGGDAQGDTLTNIENLTGSAHIDTLTGDGAANRIDGGAGADIMNGGAGNDTYVVDDAGDTVADTAGGTDAVEASVTYALSTTVSTDLENLILTGSDDINGTGNAAANTITGNSGTNILTGHAGNDTYNVQNAADTVVEAAGEGTDTVRSTVSYTISDVDVENLTLTGSSSVDATGNTSNNVLTGNSGTNTLTGGAGDDTYVVQNAADSVVELAGEGTDTVNSSVSYTISDVDVEHLTLTGSSSIDATGNASDNTLTG
ncbi:MAG: Ca2+-binding RTX toxin-like protein, partial [Paracoccaceae bacterium]